MTASKVCRAKSLFLEGWQDGNIIRELGISSATFYRAKADWRPREVRILLDDFLAVGKRFYMHRLEKTPNQPLFYDLAFAQKMCHDLGLIPRFAFRSFAELLPELGSGNFDLALGFFSDHPQRQQWADFSSPYMLRSLNELCLGVRANVSIRTDDPRSWRGMRIAVIRGSMHENFLREKAPQVVIRPFATKGSCYNAFREKWADGVLLSEMDFFPMESVPSGMRLRNCPFHFGLKSRIALQKENEPLAEQMYRYIQRAHREGVIESLSKRFQLVAAS